MSRNIIFILMYHRHRILRSYLKVRNVKANYLNIENEVERKVDKKEIDEFAKKRQQIKEEEDDGRRKRRRWNFPRTT
jgi:hypothetical protein